MPNKATVTKTARRKLSTNEKTTLNALEKTLRDRMHDFVEVGRVLDLIRQGKLYREKSDTFGEYCENEWAIARRTAYLKVKTSAVYRQIEEDAHAAGVSPTNMPKNEHIIRQLLYLDSATSPWDAWKTVLDASMGQQRLITAELVQQVVGTVRTQRIKDAVCLSLIHDDTFPGIPFRLDVYSTPTDGGSARLLLDLPRLLGEFMHQYVMEPSGERPLVMTSMQYDLFDDATSCDVRLRLIHLLGCIEDYQFLVWTTHYASFDQLSAYPENIDGWRGCIRKRT